ncbi:MAG: acetate kinase [Candidatus Peregrinibacteria bacterium]|nr:acetate kinase [Candidatus Peregrinibacteria bacterium]
MKILIINSGSSSIKSTLFDFSKSVSGKESQTEIAKAMIDEIGLKSCKFNFNKLTKTTVKNTEKCRINHHESGVKLILETLLKTKCIKDLSEIVAVGHRIVHGGEKYTKPTLLNAKIIKEIEKLSSLAPLHNPANLSSIHACQKLLPQAKQIAVFDTAFHQTMPEKAYLYALPKEFYKKYQIRRYGFHGTSHKYVINEALKILKKSFPRLTAPKIISCHLGNGSSITASVAGKSIDTTMGFTPMEGLPMGTRSGSIDPGIVLHLSNNLKFTPKEIDEILNHKSGLLALSQISSDMRDIYAQSKKGNKHAIFTLEILSYQIAKYCGGFAAAMHGVDALIFTGGIGEHAFYIRDRVSTYLKFLHIKKTLVIPTNEEKQIAMETVELV